MIVRNSVWYKVEWLVPAARSLSEKPYWHALDDTNGLPYRTDDVEEALDKLDRLRNLSAFNHSGDSYRIVKVTETVIE